VRQYEMNVNITLLTISTWVGRARLRSTLLEDGLGPSVAAIGGVLL
jgi:hypothetical protein